MKCSIKFNIFYTYFITYHYLAHKKIQALVFNHLLCTACRHGHLPILPWFFYSFLSIFCPRGHQENPWTSVDFLQPPPLLVHVVVECPLSIFRPYFVCAYNVRYAICSVASILKWIYVQKILVIFNTIHSSSMYLVLSTMCLRRCLYYHLPQVNWQCAFWNKRPKNNLLNNRKMKSRSFWIEFDWNDWIQCNLLTNQDNHKDKVGGEYSIVKDSSANLGVNSKIVQIRPTIKAVSIKI